MPVLIPMRFKRHILKKTSALLFIATMVCAFAGNHSRAQEISKEYQVKAVFLFNFAHFANWPANAFPDNHPSFVIGVLGDDPFGKFLDDTVHGETIDGRPLVVEHFQSAKEASDCQILFISRSEEKKLPSIFEACKGKNILTVGDVPGFSQSGGIIGFVTTPQNKIHFDVNLDAAKNADLVISSKLLRLADIVETQKGAAP